MNRYNLVFQGYTWDDYFYYIANNPGILVVYRGCLDSEGAVRIDELLYIGESDIISTIYESDYLVNIRKIEEKEGRLFYSYAEMNRESRADVTKTLNYWTNPKYFSEEVPSSAIIKCSGACALFPNELIL